MVYCDHVFSLYVNKLLALGPDKWHMHKSLEDLEI